MSPAIPQFRPLRHPTARRGFSFAEVMFAVVILGIGFIMVAGIFPVALQQTQVTSEQAAAAAFSRGAANFVSQLGQYAAVSTLSANPGVVPVAGTSQPTNASATFVFPFESDNSQVNVLSPMPPYPLGSWYTVSGGLIAPGDPRFAVVPLYMRPYNAKYLQLFLIGVQARNYPTYTAADLSLPSGSTPNGDPATLQPKLVGAQVFAGSPGLIHFASGSGIIALGSQSVYYTNSAAAAAASGAYVIVANDGTTGVFNGDVYRVGTQRLDLQADGTEWELQPGNDLIPKTIAGVTTTSITAAVWMVGRGLQTPGLAYSASGANQNLYAGPAQDIGVFTTFVSIP